MISERRLREWREAALKALKGREHPAQITAMWKMILEMTQELLDQHLIRR